MTIESASYVNVGTQVKYYDCDGQWLATFDRDRNTCPEARLDPNAPTLKPYSCELKYLPVCPWSSRWFIIFSNHYQEEIARYHYDRQKKQILDYSKLETYKGFRIRFDLSQDLIDSQFTEFDLTATKVVGNINPPKSKPTDPKAELNGMLAYIGRIFSVFSQH